MDKKDKLILYNLDFNARESFSKLAKKIKISKEALIYRIKRLEKRGIIKGYFTVLNTPKLGLVSYKVLLKYQNLTKEKEEEMIKFLIQLDEVGWIVKTEGIYDLMFIVWVENEIDFDDFWIRFLNKYSQYFYDKEVLILTENHACRKEYLLEKKKENIGEVIYRGRALNECDKIDSEIIYELSKNARIPALDLSKKIGLTPEAISHRIKQLIKEKIILGFRPQIDLEKINYSYHNVMLRIKNFSILSKLFVYFKNNKNITYFVKYLGKYEIGLDMEVSSDEDFRKILEKIRVSFGDDITYYDFVKIIDEIKITYGPKIK